MLHKFITIGELMEYKTIQKPADAVIEPRFGRFKAISDKMQDYWHCRRQSCVMAAGSISMFTSLLMLGISADARISAQKSLEQNYPKEVKLCKISEETKNASVQLEDRTECSSEFLGARKKAQNAGMLPLTIGCIFFTLTFPAFLASESTADHGCEKPSRDHAHGLNQ